MIYANIFRIIRSNRKKIFTCYGHMIFCTVHVFWSHDHMCKKSDHRKYLFTISWMHTHYTEVQIWLICSRKEKKFLCFLTSGINDFLQSLIGKRITNKILNFFPNPCSFMLWMRKLKIEWNNSKANYFEISCSGYSHSHPLSNLFWILKCKKESFIV